MAMRLKYSILKREKDNARRFWELAASDFDCRRNNDLKKVEWYAEVTNLFSKTNCSYNELGFSFSFRYFLH